MDDEIRVGESVEPVIQTLSDDERGVADGKLRELLITCDPDVHNVGESVADYVKGIEEWWNSKLGGGDPPVEMVIGFLSKSHGGGTTALGQVEVFLEPKGRDISPGEFKKSVEGVQQATRRIVEGRNTRRDVPILKVEV